MGSEYDYKEAVTLHPETHTYSNGYGRLFESWSTIQKSYKKVFNEYEASEAYARKNGGTPEYWRDQWDRKREKAINRGRAYHDALEGRIFDIGWVRKEDGFLPVINPDRIIHPHMISPGVYPEITLWNNGWGIAGKADKVYVYRSDLFPGRLVADVVDYKTNEEIEEAGYEFRDGSRAKMKPPIQHLDDCNKVHYTLQLSFYQYMLECWGLLPGMRILVHIPHRDEAGNQPAPRYLEVPYLKREVLYLLQHYRNTYESITHQWEAA